MKQKAKKYNFQRFNWVLKGSIWSCFMKQTKCFEILAPCFNNLLFQVKSIACFIKRLYLKSIQKWSPLLFSLFTLALFWPTLVDTYKQTELYCIFLSVFLFPLLKTQPPKPWPGSQRWGSWYKLALQLRDSGEILSCWIFCLFNYFLGL